MVWLFAGSMGHGHQGIIVDCLAQATAISKHVANICPHCKTLDFHGTEQEFTFGAESIIHVWFPITIPNDRFSIAKFAIASKMSWGKMKFHMVFQIVSGVTGIIKLPIGVGSNNANVW